jgi:GntR family transcriptional regulator
VKNKPKHILIIESIEHQISTGHLKPGAQIPSLSQLQQLFGASYGTVRAATLVLKASGLVRGEAGIGMFVVSETDGAQ